MLIQVKLLLIFLSFFVHDKYYYLLLNLHQNMDFMLDNEMSAVESYRTMEHIIITV